MDHPGHNNTVICLYAVGTCLEANWCIRTIRGDVDTVVLRNDSVAGSAASFLVRRELPL